MDEISTRPSRAMPTECAPPRTRSMPISPSAAMWSQHRLERLAVAERHRPERHLEHGRRAVPAGERHGVRFGGHARQAAVARGEPVDPADQPIRGDLDGSPSAGHRPPARRRPPPTTGADQLLSRGRRSRFWDWSDGNRQLHPRGRHQRDAATARLGQLLTASNGGLSRPCPADRPHAGRSQRRPGVPELARSGPPGSRADAPARSSVREAT